MAKVPKAITKTALRRLMKKEGDATIVSADAITTLMDWSTDTVVELTKKALAICKHAKRKTVSKADIKLAIQTI